MKNNKQAIFLIIALLLLGIDRVTKVLVDTTLTLNQHFVVIKDILSLEKLYNTGAAFSMLQNSTFLLILIAFLVILLVLFYVFKCSEKISMLEISALGFITGGAIGNLLDRLLHYYVVDFIQLDFINFPVFNFADIFINIGVIILIVSIILNRK